MKEYYDRRAAEYDQTITDGMDAEATASIVHEAAALGRALAALPAGRVLDVGCGTALFTRHFYGHLEEHERVAFLTEARRVAPELVVVDSAVHDGAVQPQQWQERVLRDGSRYVIYKRHFTPERLLAELGGQVLFDGRFFVAVQARHRRRW